MLRNAFILVAALLAVSAAALAADDPYEHYVLTSKDFQPVNQDPQWIAKAFPSWTFMPWTYQWTIGYTDESGKWSLAHGFNGAFIDRGEIASDNSKTGKLDWINKFHLHFYTDHIAGKHYLHLWDEPEMKGHEDQLHGNGVRFKPVNAEMAKTLQGLMQQSIGNVKSSPWRVAYALDDETSWGYYIHPCMWCVTDDKQAFQNWLNEIYGPAAAPHRTDWITYNDIRPKLRDWSIGQFDASPLMDQWTFNDSYWANFLGDLVQYANSLDPQTPCGIEGAQAPNAFGGYDYAKIMRKVQFIEPYNVGSTQAIVRSFNPHNAIPAVTTLFHRSSEDDVWQTWYYLAHGNRGFIGWVQGWFDGNRPQSWHDEVAPTFLLAANKIGPLMSGAQSIHDGVAIYYSHPSIQLGWILDAEAHGHTWINRNGDYRLGASHLVRHAWENMLRDSGLQYNFISYVDVIQHGVDRQYKVLILPACQCLSDVEQRKISDFCRDGGTVIADYMPGWWDQHGRGRAAPSPLDEMFAVRHDPGLHCADVFGGNLWCEVNQEANYNWITIKEFLTNQNTCLKEPSGFNKAVRAMDIVSINHFGKGTAVLMNLSPQWYNAYRQEGFAAAQKRQIFMNPLSAAGLHRWVELKNPGQREFGYEITYWQNKGRTIVFLCFNPEIAGSQTGGGNALDLRSDTLPITISFAGKISGVRDERTGNSLPDGAEYQFDWRRNEGIVMSFEGPPPPAQ